MRSLSVVLAAAGAAFAAAWATAAAAPAGRSAFRSPSSLAAAPYAPWAHHHWVWLSSDQSNQANVTAYVEEYAAHNITVGAVDIDSMWSTGVNNFVVDTTKFPDMKGLVDQMHAKSVRVILWATSMIDTDSPNYAEAAAKGYFVRNGLNESTPDPIKWWHGHGILLDYFNPEATAWWNSQLDLVLDIGVDGFKTDGTDPFIAEYIFPQSPYHEGVVTYRDYADAYYGSFFNYSRERNPEALIMSRPVDSFNLFDGVSAYLEFSPRYAVFSGWVGDQDPTFPGLVDALGNMLHSAWRGYVGFGSDIGGYRSGHGQLGRTGELLLRWAAVGAFCSLMENGGDKEHRPWKFDAPGSTLHVDAYRRLVAAHYELEQYLLTTGAQAFESNVSIMRPIMPMPADPFGIIQPDDYTTFDYMLGPDYFVSPVYKANATNATFTLPPNPAGWFSVFDRTATFPGNRTTVVQAPLGTIPAFGRRGALLPLHVSTPLLGNGDEASAGALTLLVHGPRCDGSAVSAELRAFDGPSALASYVCRPGADGSGATMDVQVSPLGRDVIVIVRDAQASAVEVRDGESTAACSLARGSSHPVFGPAAVPYKPAPAPMPAQRQASEAPSAQGLCASAWSSHPAVGESGLPVASGAASVAEVVVGRVPADRGAHIRITGVVA